MACEIDPYTLLDDPSFVFNVLETGHRYPVPTEFSTRGFDIASYRLRRALLANIAARIINLDSNHRNFINDAEDILYPQAIEYFQNPRTE
jgi:hypothetical protein